LIGVSSAEAGCGAVPCLNQRVVKVDRIAEAHVHREPFGADDPVRRREDQFRIVARISCFFDLWGARARFWA
jgi:hypothetical protein